jgi:hypothetical protein
MTIHTSQFSMHGFLKEIRRKEQGHLFSGHGAGRTRIQMTIQAISVGK